MEEILEAHERALQSGEKTENEAKILILPEFVPCQKRLSETEIAFVIFPSNRGGYCIQPQKKEYSLNYKCSFPSEWLGLENEELQKETGLVSAGFCHKGGFLLTTGTLEDAVKACEISLAEYREEPVLVNFGGGAAADKLLGKLPGSADCADHSYGLCGTSGAGTSGNLRRSCDGKAGMESVCENTGKADPEI